MQRSQLFSSSSFPSVPCTENPVFTVWLVQAQKPRPDAVQMAVNVPRGLKYLGSVSLSGFGRKMNIYLNIFSFFDKKLHRLFWQAALSGRKLHQSEGPLFNLHRSDLARVRLLLSHIQSNNLIVWNSVRFGL